MKKKIVIKRCSSCVYHMLNAFGEIECRFWDIPKDLENEEMDDGFPAWCPLDDVEESKAGDAE